MPMYLALHTKSKILIFTSGLLQGQHTVSKEAEMIDVHQNLCKTSLRWRLRVIENHCNAT